MSADDQETLDEQKPLVTRLREESRGREVVRVADPADGSYCIDFDRDNSVFPEYEATQWLMREAANEVERLQKELSHDSKRGV
jgi:hypothetical protein